MIKINNMSIPTPSVYQVGIMDLSKAERNANGDMIIDRIATKRKIEVSWQYLSPTNLSLILNAVSQVFFSIEYRDPQTNTERTGTFYVGDRSAGAMDFKNGVMRWKDIKFNLVER